MEENKKFTIVTPEDRLIKAIKEAEEMGKLRTYLKEQNITIEQLIEQHRYWNITTTVAGKDGRK